MAQREFERETTGATVAEARNETLNAEVERQVSAILEEAERQAAAPDTPAMVYRIPSPGVRYYYF